MADHGQKVAVITGANRGLGRAAAEQLTARGYRVVVTARDGGQAHEVAAGIGGLSHELDVSSDEQVAVFAEWATRELGRVDALVNNAGAIFDRSGAGFGTTALEVPAAVLATAFNTNTLGAYRLTQALVPLLRAAGDACVVNVSSGMGQLGDMGGGYPAYRASKTALNAVTRVFHNELAGDGVKVNSVCPGWVRTDMGGERATRSIEEGVDTIVWLATLPADGPSGGFFRNRQPIPW